MEEAAPELGEREKRSRQRRPGAKVLRLNRGRKHRTQRGVGRTGMSVRVLPTSPPTGCGCRRPLEAGCPDLTKAPAGKSRAGWQLTLGDKPMGQRWSWPHLRARNVD